VIGLCALAISTGLSFLPEVMRSTVPAKYQGPTYFVEVQARAAPSWTHVSGARTGRPENYQEGRGGFFSPPQPPPVDDRPPHYRPSRQPGPAKDGDDEDSVYIIARYRVYIERG
jgi:hypothetical protein